MKNSLIVQPLVQLEPLPQANVILIIASHPEFAKILGRELQAEGYSVTIASNSLDGLMQVRQFNPNLIILDWLIQGFSSLDFCERLRALDSTVPIILLTERHQVSDRVAGLNAGADDCLSKPFSMDELLARVRVCLRRYDFKDTDVLQFEDLTLNRKTREVSRNGTLIELTAKEFDLLEYLLRNRRQVVTREQILEHVWGYDFMGDSNVIEVYIRYLRLKLEAHSHSRLIHTVRCVGYVLREPA